MDITKSQKEAIIPCFLCEKKDFREIYSYSCNCGQLLGQRRVSLMMCNVCGAVMQNPRPSIEEINEHYLVSSSGAVFHEFSESTRAHKLVQERVSFIKKFISKKSGNYLDVGCGQGDLLRNININGWKNFGLEPGVNIKKNKKITFYNTTIENFNESIKFNAISLISMLEHVYDPIGVLNKVETLLEEDGVIIVEVPDSINPIAQVAEFYGFEHLTHFTKYSLENSLNLCGFEVLEFDENVLVSNIRCIARKKVNAVKKVEDDRNIFLKSMEAYKLNKSRTYEKISLSIKREIQSADKIAIYGAGFHTHFLLDNFLFLEQQVQGYFDSDSKKWGTQFRGKSVLSLDKIDDLNITVILISSHDYESEIFETLMEHQEYLRLKNIKVVRVYSK